jgi:hypothetical protein
MCQFLQNPEDLVWLREVHLTAVAPAFRSAIIYGNEDWPNKIELYADTMPHYLAEPVATITSEQIDAHHRNQMFRNLMV